MVVSVVHDHGGVGEGTHLGFVGIQCVEGDLAGSREHRRERFCTMRRVSPAVKAIAYWITRLAARPSTRH